MRRIGSRALSIFVRLTAISRSLQHWMIFSASVTFLAVAIAPIECQVLYDNNQNLLPFGGFSAGEFDTVSLQNGNLHISIPIVTLKQRGGSYSRNLVFDTPLLNELQTEFRDPSGHKFVRTVVSVAKEGFTITRSPSEWSVVGQIVNQNCGVTPPPTANYVATDPENGSHPLDLETGTNCVNRLTSPSYDGSGLLVDISSTPYKVTLKDGTVIHAITPQYNSNGQIVSESSSSEDPNGNKTSTLTTYSGNGLVNSMESSISTDDVGRTISIVNGAPKTYTSPNGGTGFGYTNTTMSYKDSNGDTQSFLISYEAIDIAPGICSGTYCSQNSTIVVPTSVLLPDGVSSYQFNWVNASAGQLQSIVLPTGGTISYTYDAPGCTLPPNGSPGGSGFDCRVRVLSRTESFNGVSQAPTKYLYGTPTGGYNTTVTDPLGNDTVHTFSYITTTVKSNSSVETNVQSYSGSYTSGKLLRTVSTQYTADYLYDYSSQEFNYSLGVVNIRPTSVTTTLDSGQVSQTQTTYEAYSFNGNPAMRLNPVEIRKYDYGTGSPGALIQRTVYAYLHNTSSNPAYSTLNIVDRPSTVTVYDGSGVQKEQTTYEYDNYTSGISASGAASHDSSFGGSFTTRGNVTAIMRWNNTNNSNLTTRNQYDDSGNVVATTDPKGNTTNFSYVDSWAGASGGNSCEPQSGNAAAYLTSAKNPLGQTTYYSYYSCTGLQATATDTNDKTTTTAYDLKGRMASVSYPDGGETATCYTDLGCASHSQTAPPFVMYSTTLAAPDPQRVSSIDRKSVV